MRLQASWLPILLFLGLVLAGTPKEWPTLDVTHISLIQSNSKTVVASCCVKNNSDKFWIGSVHVEAADLDGTLLIRTALIKHVQRYIAAGKVDCVNIEIPLKRLRGHKKVIVTFDWEGQREQREFDLGG